MDDGTKSKELSRLKARKFADKWANTSGEKQYAQSYWTDFFRELIGIEDLLATGVEFEFPIKSLKTKQPNFIDVLWRGVVLIEHKTAGKDLDVAEAQARDYMLSLNVLYRPPIIIVSDFARIRIIEVIAGTSFQFDLADLPAHLDRIEAIFTFHGKNASLAEVAVDAKGVQYMADLYVAFEKAGYEGHEVSVFMVRILFLLFGDDTRMWKRKLFSDLVELSPESGFGVGGQLQELFQALDTKKRPHPNPVLTQFPYVNGGLFAENLTVFSFTEEMRSALMAACNYDWSLISPAIFGSMFQNIKSKEARRSLGEHYTSEANILKVIRPLFLDDYLERLRKGWDDPKALRILERDLGSKNYLDPAAGSGNFLVVTFRRLRDIEHKIIARLIELEGKVSQSGIEGVYGLQVGLDGSIGLSVKVEQFHAIEYEEWSSQIASVAMFLTNHQANIALDELTGMAPDLLPLTHQPTIHHGNALRVDWASVCPIGDNTIIMGNPPFYGATYLSDEQKEDQQLVWKSLSGSGVLDYVASWYLVAARHMSGTKAKAAFVSTNSVSQGQQPATIWGQIYPLGVSIDFAHRSFLWSNEATGNAAVHCVIIGFSANPKPTYRSLWSYATPKSEPELVKVKRLNAYLLDAAEVLIRSRSKPLQSHTQEVIAGSKPADGKWLSNISPTVAEEIRSKDPIAAKYLRRVVGSEEVINGIERYGLWLVNANPSDLLNSPVLKARVAAVRAMREGSTKSSTRKDADKANEWQQIRQPIEDYIAIPRHSSQEREYVPMEILTPDIIANDALSFIPSVSSFTFGVLMSRPFSVWTAAVSGRIKSDYRISNEITYNNFPFPDTDIAGVMEKVERAAEGVLNARALFPDNTLAHLYHRLSMPSALREAHRALDKAVLNAYGLKTNTSDIGILELLFDRYEGMTQGLLAIPARKRSKPKKAVVLMRNFSL